MTVSNDKFLKRLILFTAILIAVSAAFFSVYGLVKIFNGAAMFIAIMASSLELGKLVSVSYLYTYWKRIGKGMRLYLLLGIIVLMLITSAGIYGFLSNAYQKTATKLEIVDNQINSNNTKINIFIKNKLLIENNIIEKQKRIETLNSLRNKQENRLDNELYSIRKTANKHIERADVEIVKNQILIDTLQIKIISINDSIAKYTLINNELEQSKAIAGEIGPLKYISYLLNKPINKIVNWFILLLIFVFDPLAISLVIAANNLAKYNANFDDDEEKEEISNSIINENELIENELIENDNTNEKIKKTRKIKKRKKINKKLKEKEGTSEKNTIQINDEYLTKPENKIKLIETYEKKVGKKIENNDKLMEVHPHDGSVTIK